MRRPSKHHPRLSPAAGGACIWHVETLLRLPAGALPRPGPQYHRNVVQGAGLQPAPRGPLAGRRPRVTLGALRPRLRAGRRRPGSTSRHRRCLAPRTPRLGVGATPKRSPRRVIQRSLLGERVGVRGLPLMTTRSQHSAGWSPLPRSRPSSPSPRGEADAVRGIR